LKTDPKKQPLANLLAGSVAGATSVIFTYPLDLIRVQLAIAVDKPFYNGVWDALKKIYQKEGVVALYLTNVVINGL
jgi:hypothetical protein